MRETQARRRCGSCCSSHLGLSGFLWRRGAESMREAEPGSAMVAVLGRADGDHRVSRYVHTQVGRYVWAEERGKCVALVHRYQTAKHLFHTLHRSPLRVCRTPTKTHRSRKSGFFASQRRALSNARRNNLDRRTTDHGRRPVVSRHITPPRPRPPPSCLATYLTYRWYPGGGE